MSTTKEVSPEDIAKRLAALPKDQQAAELKKIATEMGATVDERANDLNFNLSDEQFERMMSGVLSETQKVVKEVATEAEKRGLNTNDAHNKAEEFISEEVRKAHLKTEEDKIIGKRFAMIMRAQLGQVRDWGEYQKSMEAENAFLRKHYGRELRDMSLGTDSTGGYLAPELWEQRLYQNLAKTNYARKYATLINMGNKELMRMPKMTAGMSAYVVNEAAAATPSQPTFSQFTLQPKKIVALSNPVSIELLEAGDPAIVDIITSEAMRAFGRKEDEAVFVGSDSVWSGLLESSTNTVYLGGANNSGKTNANQITFDDLFNLQNELDEQYTPDEDTASSGGVGGEAFFWLNKTVITNLAKLKGDDNYHMDVQTMMKDKRVSGYGLKRVMDLTSPATSATKFAVFGNLKYVYVGYRPGIRMDVLKEGVVNGSNLGTTAQYALRFIEWFDQARIDDEAFSILSTANS